LVIVINQIVCWDC